MIYLIPMKRGGKSQTIHIPVIQDMNRLLETQDTTAFCGHKLKPKHCQPATNKSRVEKAVGFVCVSCSNKANE